MESTQIPVQPRRSVTGEQFWPVEPLTWLQQLGSQSVSSIGAIATLEKLPPSNEPEHLSAWELREMGKFEKIRPSQSVIFNTCRYQEDVEVGKRHFKPQQFEGILGNAMPVVGMHVRGPLQPRHHHRTGEIKSLRNIPKGTMRGLCQTCH